MTEAPALAPISKETAPAAAPAALPLWKRIPAPYYSATLITVILLIGQWQAGIIGGYHRMAIALSIAVATEAIFGKLLRNKVPSLVSAYISGNSVAILAKPIATALWPFVLGSFLAIASKYVFAIKGRHLWNPTNFSICFMLFVAPGSIAVLSHQWSNEGFATAIIYAVGTIVCLRARVLHLTITYIVAFLAIAALRTGFDMAAFERESRPLSGVMYTLFVFFMVTDPRTIVKGRIPQIAICILVAIVDHAIRWLGDQNVAWIQPLLPAPPLYALFLVGPPALAISILMGREGRRTA
jgi:hypothetical protein